ncbi:hypothetical protein FISHEDRAFT_74295 [Fistulina hepatica ATCC 64428]|uniref:Uncharacterized protein n=1 Tax=Fistulina hepatica ATCC 64428 TaxID=1128425 RepID=A0A0D7ACU6_9AGAR|nr:hypothetical protein FISHEDRAFT_74295 [Fistulina hepatica ATCC 64428]
MDLALHTEDFAPGFLVESTLSCWRTWRYIFGVFWVQAHQVILRGVLAFHGPCAQARVRTDYEILRDLFLKVLKKLRESDNRMFDWCLLNNGKRAEKTQTNVNALQAATQCERRIIPMKYE